MADLSFILEEIKEDWQDRASKALKSISKSNERYIQDTRWDIIREWFDPYGGTSFADHRIQEVRGSSSVNGMRGKLEFISWTDTDQIDPGCFPSAVRWTSQYGGNPVEMVSSLVFDHGIIGLPYFSRIPNYNGPGWERGVNQNFIQKMTLETYIQISPKWDYVMDKIEGEIYSKID